MNQNSLEVSFEEVCKNAGVDVTVTKEKLQEAMSCFCQSGGGGGGTGGACGGKCKGLEDWNDV